MDIIEQLIKSLEDAKAELNKNMNCAPGSAAMNKEELEKDAANPALAPKEVKVKQLQAQIDAGTYKPDPKKIAAKMLSKEEITCSENGQWDIKKWNMKKRCWEGYEPTPGKKAYSEDSCKPESK